MPTALLSFPARLYHATPWGHHVNEGLVEWPPSPWRLLRALISVGHTACGWTTMPPEARSLFERLAGALPAFALPHASGGHTRHYMPIGGLRADGIEKTTLVIDAFARIDEGVLGVKWDVELSPPEAALLGTLVVRLGYLGRSESWVEGRLLDTSDAAPFTFDVIPCEGVEVRDEEWEQVPLLAPVPPAAYTSWLASRPPPAQPAKRGKASGTRGGKGKRAPAGPPADLLGCLELTTTTLEQQGWTLPPGSRRVLYWRPRAALAGGAPAPRWRDVAAAPVDSMLLALAAPNGNAHALPMVTRALPQSEILHGALASHVGRRAASCDSLLGVGADGKPLADHRHAHLLSLDLDEDGHLDHVLIWAPMGLDDVAQNVVRAVRKTYGKRVGELRVALAGLGALARLAATPTGAGPALRLVVGPPSGATDWLSATPFVPPRYLKTRGRHTLEGQVQAELASRNLPAATNVEVLDQHEPSRLQFRHYVLHRTHGGQPPPQRLGFALRLTFDAPVRGPLCLGYASHFGLGRFGPARSRLR